MKTCDKFIAWNESRLEWFKKNVEPLLVDYKVEYREGETGDFGSIIQVDFESPKSGGFIDFWGEGWLEIDYYDYTKKKVIINILFDPDDELPGERDAAFRKLLELLLPENTPVVDIPE